MAEAIALAGSIIAIVQVASAAVKLSQSLYTTARKAGSAKEDIENFAMDMNTFASIIRSTHRSIRRYCQEESRSPAIRYIKEHNILEQVVDQATRVGRKIEQVRPPIQDLRGRLSIVNRFRWSLVNRHDVKALNPQMECVKTNLHLVMDIMILEKLQQGYRSDETRQEIEDLKDQIQVHIQTISILQKHRQASTTKPYDISSSYLPLEQISLVELAESMVETGEVPEFDTDYSSDDNSSSSSWWEMTHPRAHLHDERAQVASEMGMVPKNTETISFSSSEEIFIVTKKPSFRGLIQEFLESEPPRVDPAAGTNSHGILGNDYLAVRPEDKVLLLNTDHPVQAETGNIKTPRGKKAVTVIIDPRLEANIVSENFAVENGLEILDAENGAEVTVEVRPGEMVRSAEQVVLEWTKDLPNRKSLKVLCWVIPYNGRSPHFGKPFVERRKHYWHQSRIWV